MGGVSRDLPGCGMEGLSPGAPLPSLGSRRFLHVQSNPMELDDPSDSITAETRLTNDARPAREAAIRRRPLWPDDMAA